MEWIDQNILTLVIFGPFLGALLTLVVPKERVGWIKTIAMVSSLVTFLLSLHLVCHFQDQTGYQFSQKVPWIPGLGVFLRLGDRWLLLVVDHSHHFLDAPGHIIFHRVHSK